MAYVFDMQKYFCYKTKIGKIYITSDERGIAAVSLGKLPKGFEGIEEETYLCDQCAQELQEYFDGKRKVFTLPLSFKGTAFQNKVWRELCKIPYGQTKTYGQIAAAAGNKNGARAVGGACNKNPLMIIVPCHRVLGAGGKLTGYALGLKLKKQLLALEASD